MELAAPEPLVEVVELDLGDRPLQPQEQPVIEVRRIVDAVVVHDEGPGDAAEFEQPVPVGAGAGEARDLQPEDGPDLAEADLGDEPLEAAALFGGGPRLPEVLVDDGHPVLRPAQRLGPLDEAILPLGALAVVLDLRERRTGAHRCRRRGPGDGRAPSPRRGSSGPLRIGREEPREDLDKELDELLPQGLRNGDGGGELRDGEGSPSPNKESCSAISHLLRVGFRGEPCTLEGLYLGSTGQESRNREQRGGRRRPQFRPGVQVGPLHGHVQPVAAPRALPGGRSRCRPA